MNGRFISLEGGEGAGKSTQAQFLAEKLQQHGIEVVTTREPGGTPGAEDIRVLLVNGETERWTPTTELLLMYAARAEHVARIIRPALVRGAWVISDRYADSSFVYQGIVKGIPHTTIEEVHRIATGDLWPDLTLLFDCPVDMGADRVEQRNGSETRFESHGQAFHEAVRAGFLARARAEPARFHVIDSSKAIEHVADDVWSAIRPMLP